MTQDGKIKRGVAEVVITCSNRRTSVIVDGVDITDKISSIAFRHEVGSTPHLELSMPLFDLRTDYAVTAEPK